MNPNSGEAGPHFEVPAPQAGNEVQHDQVVEQATPDENRVGKAQPQQTANPLPAAPVLPVADDSQTQSTDPVAKPASSDDVPAKDHHVIEKQWVNKAKAIIAQTQDDPFVQKKEMSKVKADYIQKRFSKTIPTDDTVHA